MDTLEKRIEQQVARLSDLSGPDDKRIKKRVLQAIGRLKRQLSDSQKDSQTSEEVRPDETPGKRPRYEPAVKTSKKHAKAKLKLLNDELATLARKKMADVAVKRIRSAIRRGIPVDVHSYTNVVHAFVRAHDVPRALEITKEMKILGIPPNIVTYTALIKGYCEQHDLKSAIHLIRSENVDLNTRAVNTLLRGCLRTGGVDLAAQIIGNTGGCWNTPKDGSTLEYSVASLCQGLRLKDAEHVVNSSEMRQISATSSHEDSWTGCAIYVSMCRAALILCDWKKANIFFHRAHQLHVAAKTAQLRQSMLNRSRDLTEAGENPTSRSTDLFLRHRHDEFGHELELLGAYLSPHGDDSEPDDCDFLLHSLNCLLRLLHFEKGVHLAEDLSSSVSRIDETNKAFFFHSRHSYGMSLLLQRMRRHLGFRGDEPVLKILDSVIVKAATNSSSQASINFGKIFATINRSGHEFASQLGPSLKLPLKLEIGSGVGEWVCAQAKHDVGVANWIALELRSDRCHQIMSRAIFTGVSNLSILCGDAVNILSSWMPVAAIGAIFINHPQPPEHIDRGKAALSQNQGKHLLTADFFRSLRKTLAPGGTLTIVTDNQNYARLLLRIISDDVSLLFSPGEVEESLHMKEDFSIVSGASQVSQLSRNHEVISQAERFVLWRGDPDSCVGHNIQSSSYFDRMWNKGQHSRRWILYVVAK